MENKNKVNSKIEDFFKAKKKIHNNLAKLSFEEKIEILVRLQEIATNIRQTSERKHRVWKIGG